MDKSKLIQGFMIGSMVVGFGGLMISRNGERLSRRFFENSPLAKIVNSQENSAQILTKKAREPTNLVRDYPLQTEVEENNGVEFLPPPKKNALDLYGSFKENPNISLRSQLKEGRMNYDIQLNKGTPESEYHLVLVQHDSEGYQNHLLGVAKLREGYKISLNEIAKPNPLETTLQKSVDQYPEASVSEFQLKSGSSAYTFEFRSKLETASEKYDLQIYNSDGNLVPIEIIGETRKRNIFSTRIPIQSGYDLQLIPKKKIPPVKKQPVFRGPRPLIASLD
jgi:hypothetical protein